MIQHDMQTLKVGHKVRNVRLLFCHFVIFHLAVGDINRGGSKIYIYIIYYFIIYIIYYIHARSKNDKMTK